MGLQPPDSAEETYDDFVEEIRERQRVAYDIVREHLGQVAQRAKNYYDLSVRPRKFRVGDWVYFYYPRRYQGKADKWLRKYKGPYLVVDVLGPVMRESRKRGEQHRSWSTSTN